MDPLARWAFAVRRIKMFIWVDIIVVLAALASLGGCRHGRNVMRPIFGRPAVVVPATVCPGGDCGGAVIPSEPGFAEPAAVSPAPLPYGEETYPISPPANGQAAPRGAPSTVGEEPILEPTTPGVRDNDHSNGARGEPSNGPALEPPARSSARPAPRSHAPLRRATLRRNVQAYVNDPADLFTPPRADRPWRYIVLHHSAHASGSLRQIDRDHRERLGTAGCGYHFVIGNGSDSPDGQVEVATRWSKQEAGQHCRDSRVADINDYGIGICLVGNLDASPPTPRQVEAAKALISYLQDRYGIASVNVVTHDLIARTATACPGKHFPTQALLGHDRNLTAR